MDIAVVVLFGKQLRRVDRVPDHVCFGGRAAACLAGEEGGGGEVVGVKLLDLLDVLVHQCESLLPLWRRSRHFRAVDNERFDPVPISRTRVRRPLNSQKIPQHLPILILLHQHLQQRRQQQMCCIHIILLPIRVNRLQKRFVEVALRFFEKVGLVAVGGVGYV